MLLLSNLSIAQVVLTNETQNKFNRIHNEKMFIHYNSNFLLTGESFNYKTYILNSSTNLTSDLSKVAYVELIGEGNQPVFKHKIKLVNGQGSGDFLLTSTIKSGNYKLVGYTLWMKNQKQKSFFIENITIINPFEDKLLTNTNDSLNAVSTITKVNNALSSIDKDSYKTREKVSLDIHKLIENNLKGNYSVSVRKFDAITKNKKTSSLDFLNSKTSLQKERNVGDVFFLPELRGNILYGSISNSTPNKSNSQVKVALSIPGKDNYSKITETNSSGQFIFNINDTYENTKAFVQIIDDSKENYTLTIKDLSKNTYKNFIYEEVKTNDKIDALIQKRSVYNQIENAYLAKKSDTILKAKNLLPAYKNIATKFNLDDYKRFKSMKDIFVEIIENSWVKESKGNYTFYVTGNQQNTSYNLLPLVLIDGLIIQNHNDLFNINTKSLKNVWVYKNLYNFGAKTYQGIIALETFKSDYTKDIVFYDKHHKTVNLFKPQQNKKYFNQEYTNNSSSRIPDFRHQLFWEPNLKMNSDNSVLTFFTSDNIGTYEVNIEGFSNSGKPISIKQYFEVK
jgi:hypothetical protein